MITESYIKYLLSDDASLQTYYVKKEKVGLGDIGRHLMLEERANNVYVPDHYYRLGQRRTLDGIKTKSQLFTIGLKRLACDFLEIRNGKICLKADKMNQWQLLLPYMPPLILMAVRMWHEYGCQGYDDEEYVSQIIRPNIAYTTISSPYIPQIMDMLREGGLADLHVHLNGSLETDLTWQDFLRNPLEIRHELEKAYGNEKVMEQYEQTSLLSTPSSFYKLLKTAACLRQLLFFYAYDKPFDEENGTFEVILNAVTEETMQTKYATTHHPMEALLNKETPSHLMECMLYVRLLHTMNQQPENDTVSSLFHYYLLILGLANKMMVQQPTSYGFEEFQKITLNGLREYSEKSYDRRFLQMSGNELRHIRVLEGRFSPKDTQDKNEEMLTNIQKGWESLQDKQKPLGIESELRLVAHFIKKEEKTKDEYIRYKKLRRDIDYRATLLLDQLHEGDSMSKAVVGIDAAASEFDTPPEVFAPAYRRLRKGGFEHFTYHAGEDFYHILGGLRAIYEAVNYLGLERCDRIGHATASGVSVDLWQKNIGRRMLIKKGEHLDNFIFAYHLISTMGDAALQSLLPAIAIKIDKLSFEIYHDYYPASMHVEAWRMRGYDPEELLESKPGRADREMVENIFIRYHEKEISEKYDEIIEIETFDLLGARELTQLQLLLLKYLHDKEIVIETLPTSNVIIGHHHDYGTYHLYNWYRWKKEGKPLPPIVVGTDDTGIFATNIYNEYCNIFCQMVYGKGMNADEATAFIRELDRNARLYAFEGSKR